MANARLEESSVSVTTRREELHLDSRVPKHNTSMHLQPLPGTANITQQEEVHLAQERISG